jgi:hypothetical protein
MLCPSCRHTASLHYPDGCHGGNFQCECSRSRDDVFAAIMQGVDGTPRRAVARFATTTPADFDPRRRLVRRSPR